MEIILAVCATTIALVTLGYVIWKGQKLSDQITTQIRQHAERNDAQIDDIHFFLPAKNKRPISVFEEMQLNHEEVISGKEIEIGKQWESELHVRFKLDTPQNLRTITWGFPGKADDMIHDAHPRIIEYRTPFITESVEKTDKDIYRDWDDFWHIEFPAPKFLPQNRFFMICFTVKADTIGRFPLELEIITEETASPLKEQLWVEITD